MSEKPSGRRSDDAAHGPAKAKPDSQLRLVTEEGAVVFPEDAGPNDESPTIISKAPPAQANSAIKIATPEALLGSLRGRKLAHFELIEPIGVGGMAAVLRARDTQLDRIVALKILPPDMAHEDENIRRFHQEARAAAKLDHENIARVFFCGEDQKLHFIAFEFVEGDNLRTILESRGRLPVAEAVRYILQIATGLEHAASRGVVHRDVKPSNIIITPNGRAKLVDMGLARNVEPHTDQLTQSGMTLGTFDYISPEQALEPREADSRSDVYSLGCTFYHMLTGHPPVPEGTAAKKLHHHQHVLPTDPRQYNRDIPDEVALILGKMMAKNPKDRYQRPVQLVQHLMQMAHKVGAAADMPEGVMFVDAPLLSAPRKRPLLLISAATLALAAVLMVLSLAPPNRPNLTTRPATPKDDRVAKDAGTQGTKSAAVTPQLVNKVPEIASEQDLIDLLADTTSRTLKAKVVQSFKVSKPGLLFAGGDKRTLILEGAEEEEEVASPPTITISWKYQPKDSDEPTALLLVDGGDVKFKNLKFSVEATETPRQAAATIAVRGPGTARFVRCDFRQVDLPLPPFVSLRPQRVPLASVLVYGGGKNDRPRLELEQCFFHSGQAAVSVLGSADVYANHCAFRPHGATIHLRGEGDSKIVLQHCSVFVVTGPALRIDDQATCQLKIDYSIFSCPDSTINDRDPLHLIHQTDGKEPQVAFLPWTRNCYHNLNALWSWPTDSGGRILATLDEFQKEIANRGGRDMQSTHLTDSVNIWNIAAPHTKNGNLAFRLNPEVLEVRTLDRKSPLGIEKSIWGDFALAAFKEEPKVAEAVVAKQNEKIVDPTSEGKFIPGVFETVDQALNAAKPGDVILIKHGAKREMDVAMTSLKKPGVDVIVRPFEGFQPILTLGPTLEPNAYFFRLHDGKMTFEQLEIVLEPDQLGFKTQTLALLDGNASCIFRNCVITLKPNLEKNPSKTVPLSVVTLSDISEEMMMMGARTTRVAEVVFENCFIRGDGEAIGNRAGRPLEARFENTVVGLTGSLLALQGGLKEAAPETSIKLNLFKSSLFTGEPLIVARQNRHPKGLPPIRVERAKDCLFVTLDEKPLIVTEYPDMSDAMLTAYFDWKDLGNAYCGFNRMFEDVESNYTLEPKHWKDTFCKDADLRFVRASFLLPMSPRQLWVATPELFKPRAEFQVELQPYGAILENQPLPPVDRKAKSE